MDHLSADFIAYSPSANSFIFGSFLDVSEVGIDPPAGNHRDTKENIDLMERALANKRRGNLDWWWLGGEDRSKLQEQIIDHGYQFYVIDADRIYSIGLYLNDFGDGGHEVLLAKVGHNFPQGFAASALMNGVIKRLDHADDPIISSLSVSVTFVDWGEFHEKRFRKYFMTGSYMTGNAKHFQSRVDHFSEVLHFLSTIEKQAGVCLPMTFDGDDYQWREFSASRIAYKYEKLNADYRAMIDHD